MARMRTPRGGKLGAVAGGLGEGLDQFMQYWNKKKLMEKQDQLVSGREVKLKQMDEDYKDKQQAKLDLEKVPAFIGSIGPDATDQQLQAGLDKAGANTKPVYGQMPSSGSPDNLESTQFGPTAAKPWLNAVEARGQAQASEAKKAIRTADEAGGKKYAEGVSEAAAVHDSAPAALDDKVEEKTTLGPIDATNAGLKTGAELDATNDPARQEATAVGAGLKAGATAKAEFPFQQSLAKTRADLALSNATAIDEFKRLHPKATAQQLERVAGAHHALEMSAQTRAQLAEMEKRGMTGALKGRAADMMAGKIKSEALFKNPEDAQLASEFFSGMGFLAKKAAQVHGGLRAGSSPEMARQFEKLINGFGDRSMTEGQLNTVDRIMRIYAENPDAPDNLAIPGLEPASFQGPHQPGPDSPLPPSIGNLLNRKPNGR